MKLHLVDGTYELFRAYFAMPSILSPDGRSVGAVRGLAQTLLALLRGDDVSHVACAFDRVIESFRNSMFQGYKTGSGVPEELMRQFDLAEKTAASLGIVVWPMVEFEADDAMATAAARWRDTPEMEQVVICSPDKDLTQMVVGTKVVCLDRRRHIVLDEQGVIGKFGVSPGSIPDYLGLVGDSADGIPGIPRWGAKTTAQVLSRYPHIEDIPENPAHWGLELRGAGAAAESLAEHRTEAMLYRELATLRRDVPLAEGLTDLEWRGVPRAAFQKLCAELGFSGLVDQVPRWSEE